MKHRCFVDSKAWVGDRIRLGTVETHHLMDVLRAKSGDVVTVFDGLGREATARLVSGSCDGAELSIVETIKRADPAVRLVLIQAIPKAGKMDLIIEKATEIGVSEIFPVITERTIVRLTPAQKDDKVQRWQRVATSAAKQSNVARVPGIRPVNTLVEAIAACGSLDILLIPTLESDTIPLKTVLRSKRDSCRNVGVMIGPEGDFSPAEVTAARAAGAVPVSLGEDVLRVETAALYVLSVLTYELGLR